MLMRGHIKRGAMGKERGKNDFSDCDNP